LTLVPYIAATAELKTKPTQHSVRELMQIGIQPDILVCRTERPLSEEIKRKIALFCNVDFGCVVESPDVRSIDEIPLKLHEQGLGGGGCEGLLAAPRCARQRELPFLGICLGLQPAIIEFARNVVRLPNTNSSEFEPECENPVIALLRSQEGIHDMGGTMRLGAYPCKLRPGSRAAQVYGSQEVSQRHRHRYEVSNAYRDALAE